MLFIAELAPFPIQILLTVTDHLKILIFLFFFFFNVDAV